MINSEIQKALDSIEEYANKNGWGMFESNFDEDGERGEIHLMRTTKLGMAIGPHSATSRCLCNPKILRETPIKIYLHEREI